MMALKSQNHRLGNAKEFWAMNSTLEESQQILFLDFWVTINETVVLKFTQSFLKQPQAIFF